MSDLAFRGTFEDRISPALKKIEGNVEKLNNKFVGLKSALAGLAIGAAIRNVINLADGIQDVSDATGMAVQNVLGFQQAVQLNGGTAEQATQSIYKLTQSIGEAAAGGKKTQEAFGEVGVTLQDLATLSEQDILAKTIQGLAKIDDAGKRAVLTTDLLGKSFRGVNVQGVAGQLAAATASSLQYAKAVQQTAEMQNKLDIAVQKLQLSLLKAIQPLVELVNKMDDEKVGNMIEAIVKLGAAIAALAASLYIIERLGKGLLFLAGAFTATYAAFKIGLGGMIAGFASLAATAGITFKVLMKYAAPAWINAIKNGSGLVAQMALTFQTLGKRLAYAGFGLGTVIGSLIRMIPFVAKITAAIYLLNEATTILTGKSLTGWFDEAALAMERLVTDKFPKVAAALNKLNEMLGMGPPPSVTAAAQAEHENEMQRLKNRGKAAEEANKKANKKPVRGVAEAGTLTQDLAKQVAQYKLINDEHVRYSDRLRTSLGFQVAMVGLTEDQVELETNLRQEAERYKDVAQSLMDKQSELKAQLIGNKDADKAALYNAEIQKIEETLKLVSKQHYINSDNIERQLTRLQSARMVEQGRKQDIENTTKAIEAQISRQQQLGDLMISANDKMKDTQFAGAQQQRNPLEQQLANIQEEARKAALEAGRAFSAAFEGMDLTSAQSEELANGLQQIADKYKAIATEQTNQLTISRTWDQGWKTAFDNYMDNATNAAQQAGQAFSSITRNMESAIDNFVETGKFSFKDFTRSIIQDLLKIELKAQATKLLGMMGGGGGIFSAIGSLFGFANGGTPPLNKPSIVGENGPELFVPKSAGTVVPGKEVNMGGGAISAPVTNNYITNNISAMDAKSVAQLFAENRKTLLGSVEMARKEMPYSNR